MRNLLLLILCFCISCTNKNHELKDTIIVGTCADNPPFEFIRDGNIVGFDIDLINKISQIIGKKIIIKNMSFQGLIPALHSHDIDVLIAGISETETRKSDIFFSIPYAESSMLILTKENLKINSLNDLKHKTIGAQISSTMYQKAREIRRQIPEISVRTLGNNLLLINELMLNNIDALIIEASQAKKILQTHPNLNQFELEGSKNFFSIACTKNYKNNDAIITQINDAILQLKEDGDIAILEKKWLNYR